MIDFTADKVPLGQGVFVIASGKKHTKKWFILTSALGINKHFLVLVCLMSVLFCAVFICHIRSAKFSRIRDSLRWCRSERESLRMEAMASEKSPLRHEFLEDSESEDEPFFVERRWERATVETVEKEVFLHSCGFRKAKGPEFQEFFGTSVYTYMFVRK